MRKVRKLLPGLVILLLALVLAVGGVYSYMFAQTEDAANQLIPAKVTCEVHEVFENNQKTSITVTNTDTSTVDAYIRVRLVTYWVNDAKEIVAKPSAGLTVNVADGWLAGTDNTYYYRRPVKPGETTDNLLKDVITLVSEDGYNQVIEVFAEAIQALGTTDEGNVPAVTDAWGVTIDANGVITKVE